MRRDLRAFGLAPDAERSLQVQSGAYREQQIHRDAGLLKSYLPLQQELALRPLQRAIYTLALCGPPCSIIYWQRRRGGAFC